MLVLLSTALAVPAVAVADLANQTGDERYDPAMGGAASMLVTKLTKIDDIRVVERSRLNAVLQEVQLSRSGAVDAASRIEAGRLIGADFLVMGTMFSIQPGVLTVNLQVVDTETSVVVRGADVVGAIGKDGAGFFDLIDKLVDQVVLGLALDLSDAERIAVDSVRLRELEALLKYGEMAATETPTTTASTLWRDRSRDMMKDDQRKQFVVFTNGGARVETAWQFAELVGDREILGLADDPANRRDVRRLKRDPIGWHYTVETADRWIGLYNDRLLESR